MSMTPSGGTSIHDDRRAHRSSTAQVDGRDVVVRGSVLRIASLRDDWYATLEDPVAFVASVAAARVEADLVELVMRPPAAGLSFPWPFEIDNCAAIELRSYENWWKQQIGSKTRALVRKAEKSGVVVREVQFDDVLVSGIKRIYDEVPIRQGKPFWHYQKSLDQLRDLHGTYLDRSDFIGAYVGAELVGFVKLTYAGATANTMHIIGAVEHRDKAVMNALLAKAVAVACRRDAKLLVYDKYDYEGGGSESLLLFKKNNGFVRTEFPRYFVPLTTRGRFAVSLGLHRPLAAMLPRPLWQALRRVRGHWYAFRATR